jgi:hypothetical protein
MKGQSSKKKAYYSTPHPVSNFTTNGVGVRTKKSNEKRSEERRSSKGEPSIMEEELEEPSGKTTHADSKGHGKDRGDDLGVKVEKAGGFPGEMADRSD